MKKCKKCDAIQSDDRNTCIDCGTVLGRSMSEAEEESAEAALDDKLHGMAERTDDFYVPLRDKIMGIICIIGVIAAVILISLCGTEKQQIRNDIPEGVFVSQSGGAIITVSGDSAPEYAFPSSQIHTLGHAQMYALFGIVGFIAAGPMLLFPRFMWFLDTLKYRLYHNWDTTPSYFALVMRKVVTYVAFAIGVGSVLYGYFLFL